jgi:hypothetical protein
MDIVRATDLIGSISRPRQPAAIAEGVAHLSRTLVLGFGLLWALTMSVAGGLMMLGASEAAPWFRATLLCAGFTGIISGVFVFQVLVAGRLLPKMNPRLVRNVEASLGVALMIGVLLTTLTLLP